MFNFDCDYDVTVLMLFNPFHVLIMYDVCGDFISLV
jgi:hypothetical protein